MITRLPAASVIALLDNCTTHHVQLTLQLLAAHRYILGGKPHNLGFFFFFCFSDRIYHLCVFEYIYFLFLGLEFWIRLSAGIKLPQVMKAVIIVISQLQLLEGGAKASLSAGP